jgi:hypothetical protein
MSPRFPPLSAGDDRGWGSGAADSLVDPWPRQPAATCLLWTGSRGGDDGRSSEAPGAVRQKDVLVVLRKTKKARRCRRASIRAEFALLDLDFCTLGL